MPDNAFLPPGTLCPRELEDFTPLIADNLDVIGELIGDHLLHLASHGRTEGNRRKVGKRHNTGFVDVLARIERVSSNVVIENQIGPADAGHLKRLSQYATGHSASLVIWIAENFDEEIIAALEKRNQDPDATFQVCAIAFRVPAALLLAPYFEVILRPARGAGSAPGLLNILPCVGEWHPLAPLWATLQILHPSEVRRSRQCRHHFRRRQKLIGGWRVEWGVFDGEARIWLFPARRTSESKPPMNLQPHADLIKARLGVELECQSTGMIALMRRAISDADRRDWRGVAQWLHERANALEAVLRDCMR